MDGKRHTVTAMSCPSEVLTCSRDDKAHLCPSVQLVLDSHLIRLQCYLDDESPKARGTLLAAILVVLLGVDVSGFEGDRLIVSD